MDGNDFFLEVLVRGHLAAARAEAARQAVAAAVGSPRRSLRATIGAMVRRLAPTPRTRW